MRKLGFGFSTDVAPRSLKVQHSFRAFRFEFEFHLSKFLESVLSPESILIFRYPLLWVRDFMTYLGDPFVPFRRVPVTPQIVFL